jgi:hypothetical protein
MSRLSKSSLSPSLVDCHSATDQPAKLLRLVLNPGLLRPLLETFSSSQRYLPECGSHSFASPWQEKDVFRLFGVCIRKFWPVVESTKDGTKTRLLELEPRNLMDQFKRPRRPSNAIY